MPTVDEFGKPDREGFEILLGASFVRSGGMLFRRRAAVDSTALSNKLPASSSADVQRELNHTHLLLYVEDIEIQRQWADELEEHWRKRFEREYPDLDITLERSDTGDELVVTFWSKGRV